MVTERNFIKQNVKRMLLREFIKGSIERAGFGGIEVKRNPMGTKIKLTCERPGMIIGKKGKTIKELTETLQTKFEIENPQVEVEDVKSPNLNPTSWRTNWPMPSKKAGTFAGQGTPPSDGSWRQVQGEHRSSSQESSRDSATGPRSSNRGISSSAEIRRTSG